VFPSALRVDVWKPAVPAVTATMPRPSAVKSLAVAIVVEIAAVSFCTDDGARVRPTLVARL
jgi:hypothetical protein